jgi:hypothetical protein
MEEGLFPHQGMNPEEERDQEEERRLFYVAVTRAKNALYLTLARVRRIYGTDYLQDPSSFLNDILGQLLKGTGAFIQNLFSKEGQHMTLRYGTNERIAMDNATNDMLEKKGLAPSVKVLRNRERNYGIAA